MENYNHKRTIPLAISFVVALAISVYVFWYWEDMAMMASATYRDTMGVLVVLMYAWSLIAWLVSGHRFVCVYVFFLLYAFTSNAGQTLIHILNPHGVYAFTDVYAEVSTGVMCRMLLFQLLCIAFLNLGALLGARNSLMAVPKVTNPIQAREKPIAAWTHILFLGSGAIIALDAMSSFFVRRSMSYADMYATSDSVTNTYILFMFAATSFYVLYNIQKRYFKWYVFAYALVAVMYFIAGMRTKAIPLIFTLLLVLYLRVPRVFAKRYLWIFIPLLFLFFAISGATAFARTAAMGTVSYGDLLQQGVGYMAEQSIYEMGMSAKTICTTFSAFDHGTVVHEQTILYSLILAIIPRPLLNMIGITAPSIGSLSAFATGGNASGAGYSFIAEFYFDFGIYAFLPMLLYGYLITAVERRADDSVKQGRFLFASIVYAILCKQIFFARASFDLIYNYLRNGFYVFLIWFFISGVIKGGKLRIPRLYAKKETSCVENEVVTSVQGE